MPDLSLSSRVNQKGSQSLMSFVSSRYSSIANEETISSSTLYYSDNLNNHENYSILKKTQSNCSNKQSLQKSGGGTVTDHPGSIASAAG